MINQKSIQEQTGIAPGSRGRCPSCGSEKSFNVMKHGKFGKCFRPSCGFSISAKKEHIYHDAIHAIMQRFMADFRAEIAVDPETGKPLHLLGQTAYSYLVNDRRVHPDVIRDSLIGCVPADFDDATYWEESISTLQARKIAMLEQQRLDKSTESDDQGEGNTNGKRGRKKHESDDDPIAISSRLADAITHLEDLRDTFASTHKLAGWLVLATTDAYCNVIGFKFRLPDANKKRFASFYTIPKHHGVFGANLFSTSFDDSISANSPLRSLIVTEGEFNALAIQSTIKRSAVNPDSISYANVIALGSATSPDFETVKTLQMPVIIVHDNDEPGKSILKTATESISFEACTTVKTEHGHECKDIDELVMSFPDSQNGAKSAMRAIAEVLGGRKTQYVEIAAVVKAIEAIRATPPKGQRKQPEHVINDAVADVIITDLSARGIFYYNSTTDEKLWFCKEKQDLIRIDFEDTKYKNMLVAYKINPSDHIAKFVHEQLHAHCVTRGTSAKLHVLSHYDPANNKLHIFNFLHTVFTLSADSSAIASEINGTGGLLFAASSANVEIEIKEKISND